jgi:hypothetical protein
MLQENIGRKAMLISMLSKDGFDSETAEKLYKIEMQVTKYFEYGGVVPNYFELQDIEMGKEEKRFIGFPIQRNRFAHFVGKKARSLQMSTIIKEFRIFR